MNSPFEQENVLLEAENLRLTQEIARQAGVIKALLEDPPHSRMILPNEADLSFPYVVHGSPEALARVCRAVTAQRHFQLLREALAITERTIAGPAGAGVPS